MMENKKPSYLVVDAAKIIDIIFSLIFAAIFGALFSSFMYNGSVVGIILEPIFWLVLTASALYDLYFFKFDKIRIVGKIKELAAGVIIVCAVWLVFSIFVAAAVTHVFDLSGRGVGGIFGIVGVLLTIAAAIKLKRKAFIAGAVLGGIYPIMVSGSCMMSGY